MLIYVIKLKLVWKLKHGRVSIHFSKLSLRWGFGKNSSDYNEPWQIINNFEKWDDVKFIDRDIKSKGTASDVLYII